MNNRKRRHEESVKKEKQKKLIIAATVALVAIVAALVVYNVFIKKESRVFKLGDQTVTLQGNGKFKAELAHDENFNGTYTESEKDGVTTVTFTYNNGKKTDGTIKNDILTIPHEWTDEHDHGSYFKLVD